MTAAATRIDPPLIPGSPEWRREMTASKVAAALGLSPWESRFSLWHKLAGQLDFDDLQTSAQSRGHFLEPAVAAWLADQTGLHLRPGGCWRNAEHPWMVASPDRLAYASRYARKPLALVEIKTSGEMDEWGPDGSDEIPPGYRAQVVFQLDTLGLKTAHVAVLLPRLQFRGYVIRHDEGEAAFIRGEVTAFLDSLPGGPAEQVPSIDDHDQTFRAIRELHPDIEDREAEVPLSLATAYCDAVTGLRAAEDEHQLRRSELAQHMGAAKKAVVRTGPDVVHTIAARQAKAGGTPFVKAATKLPDLTLELSA